MTDTPVTVAGIDWGGMFGRDPLVIIAVERRLGHDYTVIDELDAPRATYDLVTGWVRACRERRGLVRVWTGADESFGADALQQAIPDVRIAVVPFRGAGSADAGYRLIAALGHAGRFHAASAACPRLHAELTVRYRLNARGMPNHENHAVDALRYALMGEQSIPDRPGSTVPLREQQAMQYRPGVGWVDRPDVTYARRQWGPEPPDRYWDTWTDRAGWDTMSQQRRTYERMLQFLGVPVEGVGRHA